MISRKFIIEVGANNGNDTARFLSSGAFVLAFEPHPELYHKLYKTFEGHIIHGNLGLAPYAVSDYNGKSNFNISMLGDMGTSSLYNYHENLLQTPLERFEWYKEGFAGRGEVTVVRLDSFLRELKCFAKPSDEIDFLHIDAQGSDFNVLKGLGEDIYKVIEGRCEVTYKVPIYSGSDNTYENVSEWLKEKGFDVKIDYVHDFDSEIDLHFKRNW